MMSVAGKTAFFHRSASNEESTNVVTPAKAGVTTPVQFFEMIPNDTALARGCGALSAGMKSRLAGD